jgi:hypothetical protein
MKKISIVVTRIIFKKEYIYCRIKSTHSIPLNLNSIKRIIQIQIVKYPKKKNSNCNNFNCVENGKKFNSLLKIM